MRIRERMSDLRGRFRADEATLKGLEMRLNA
jgi:hypothetical protein